MKSIKFKDSEEEEFVTEAIKELDRMLARASNHWKVEYNPQTEKFSLIDSSGFPLISSAIVSYLADYILQDYRETHLSK